VHSLTQGSHIGRRT
jgi:ADP-ribose pyrophosphatase YjhB (NUDIX family)